MANPTWYELRVGTLIYRDLWKAEEDDLYVEKRGSLWFVNNLNGAALSGPFTTKEAAKLAAEMMYG